MTIIIRSKKTIVALHNDQVYIFSVKALEGKEKDSPEPRVIGISIDNDLIRHEVFYGTQLVKLLLCEHTHVATDEKTGETGCPGCGATKPKNGEWNNAERTTITLKRLRELEYASDKLDALEFGGVDNWEWYDDSMEKFRAERE